MLIQTNLDCILIFLVFSLSILGLLRGFLNELGSIINWFASLYLTAKIKPLVVPLFKSIITIPFLLDIVVNAILFVSLMIGVSILNKFLISKLKQYIPNYTNSELGFLVGCAKGVLLCCMILAFLSVIYDHSSKKPNWLYDSYIYNSSKNKNSLFVDIIKSILGDVASENKETKNNSKNDEKNKKIEDIKEEINSIKDDVIDSINENAKESIRKINEDVSESIKDINENTNTDINKKDIEKLINILTD